MVVTAGLAQLAGGQTLAPDVSDHLWQTGATRPIPGPESVCAGQHLVRGGVAVAGPFGEGTAAMARRHTMDPGSLAPVHNGWLGWLIPGHVIGPEPPVTPSPTTPPTATGTPPPTRRPATRTPTPTPAPAWQYTPDGPVTYTSNPGLTRILGVIRDAAGQPVDGVLVQCCTNQCWTSLPSGSCGPGCYDFSLGDWSRNCKWLVTIVDAEGNALSPSVLVETTDVGWMSIATLNWRKHW